MKGTVQVEPYCRVSKLKRAVITATARLCGFDVIIIPWGKEGDMIVRPFVCRRCNTEFPAAVSMANEETIACPKCGTEYLVRNNTYEAWIAERFG